MSEIEINIESGESEAPMDPAAKAAEDAKKKAELDVLWSTLKKLLSGSSGLVGAELDAAKAEITKKIADCLECEGEDD